MSINDHIRTKLSSADKKAKKERDKQINEIIELSQTFLDDTTTDDERRSVARVLVDERNALEHIKNGNVNKALGILRAEMEESDGLNDRWTILRVVNTLERRSCSNVNASDQVVTVG